MYERGLGYLPWASFFFQAPLRHSWRLFWCSLSPIFVFSSRQTFRPIESIWESTSCLDDGDDDDSNLRVAIRHLDCDLPRPVGVAPEKLHEENSPEGAVKGEGMLDAIGR
jgi:hypothetical protein